MNIADSADTIVTRRVVRRIMLGDMSGALFFSVIIKALMRFLPSEFNTVAFTRVSMLETSTSVRC